MSRADRDVNILECNSIALGHIMQNANAKYRAGDITAEERDAEIRNQAAAEIAHQHEEEDYTIARTYIEDVCKEYAANGIDLMANDVTAADYDASLAEVVELTGMDEDVVCELWNQMAEEEWQARADDEKELVADAALESDPSSVDSMDTLKQANNGQRLLAHRPKSAEQLADASVEDTRDAAMDLGSAVYGK